MDPVLEEENSFFRYLKMDFHSSLLGDRVSKISSGSSHSAVVTGSKKRIWNTDFVFLKQAFVNRKRKSFFLGKWC